MPRLYCFVLSFILCGFASAEPSQTEMAAVKLAQAPTIDGVVDEASEWLGAASGQGAIEILSKTASPEGMQFWISTDQEYLYFAARMADSQPDAIVAQETRKNVSLSGNDSITLVLDVLGSLKDFNTFSINPAGANSISIAGGRAAKAEWLGEILTAGSKTATGWEAEARIPWKIMRLPAPGERTIRFNVRRYIPRISRDVAWRLTDGDNLANIGSLTGVNIPKIENPRTVQLLPYAYVGQDEEKFIFNSGLDFRTKLMDRLELVGAINPDFRNIENQILSLDFSYFERLASDSRPFFAEGSSYFRTGYDARIFASQRVPSFDVGVKAFGKLNDRSQFGVMDLNTFGKQNAFVAAYNYFPNSRSNIDVAVSSLRRDGVSNDASFVNYSQGIGPNLYYANVMTSADNLLGGGSRITTGFFSEVPGRNMWFDLMSIDSNFRPRLGFNSETDVKGMSGGLGRRKTYKSGALSDTGWEVYGEKYWRQDGDPYRSSIGGSGSIAWKNGFDLDFSARKSTFEEFNDERYSISLEWPRGDRYRRYEYNHTYGFFSGKRYRSHGVNVSLQPHRDLVIGASVQFVSHFDEASQLIISANWDLHQNRAISGRIVRRDNDYNAYVSFRQSGGRGNEYFLILGDPNARQFKTSLILKVVTPIDLRI